MSINNSRRARLSDYVSGLALVTALLSAGPVLAQAAGSAGASTTPTPSTGGIQTITVTAEFRKENVQNTPIAITAVNAATLEARSQTNIVQVAAQAPNVTLQKSEGAFGNAITASIRGVGQGDSDPALEPGVGLYVDDVYYSQLTGSVLDLLDVDRVELLRGPQGTLEGKNSIGGAVRIFSKKPTGDNAATLQATYGDFNRTEFRADGDFAIVPDKLFARISGVSKNQDGYVTRLDFACANPTIQLNGAGSPFVPNPIPVNTNGRNCKVGTEGGADYTAERGMLRWLATDKIEVNLIADYTNENSEGAPVTLIQAADVSPPMLPFLVNPTFQNNIGFNCPGATCVRYNSTLVPQLLPKDPYVTYASFSMPGGVKTSGIGAPVTTAPFSAPDETLLRSWGLSATIDWQLLDNLAFKSITAYRRYDSIWSEDNDVSPMPVSLGFEQMWHWQVSQEERLSGTFFDKALEYTIGGYYFDQLTTYATHQDLLYSSPNFHFLGHDPIKADTEAAFLNAIWHVTDTLEVEGGVRYTFDEKTYTFSRRNAETFGNTVAFNAVPACGTFECGPNWEVFGLDGKGATAKTSRADYRAAADYHWTPNFMTYFQFSTGFKGGGVDPRPFNPHQVLPFGPEKLQAYEVGFKSTLWDMIRLNGSLFKNDYNGVQLTVNNCTAQAGLGFGAPCALPVNGANANVWGAELEGEIHPTEAFSIDASGSYLHFKYHDIVPAVAASGVTTAMVTPNTPKWKWSVGAQYELDLGDYGSLTPRVDANYQASFFGAAVNAPSNKVRQRTLANARLTWRSPDKTLEAAFEVTNLADKFYYVNIFDLSTVTPFIAGQPGQPREWAFTIKKKF